MQNLKYVEKQRILVILVLTTGESLYGFIQAAQSERLSDVLNDPRMFVPFEDMDGEHMLHAKTSILRLFEICNVTKHFTHPDPYVALNVNRSDSWDAIQRAYRRQMRLCHPDRFAGRNPPRAALELLEQIAQRLNEILDMIKPRYITDAA